MSTVNDDVAYRGHLRSVAMKIVELVLKKDEEYGASWKRRGGVGAFMMMTRKTDRIEEQCKKHGYDVFAALDSSETSEGIADTIQDLVGYCLLVLSEHASRKQMDSLDVCKCGHRRRDHYVEDGDTGCNVDSNQDCRCPGFRLDCSSSGDKTPIPSGEPLYGELNDKKDTLVLARCWRCHGFHLDECPQDPGPAHP